MTGVGTDMDLDIFIQRLRQGPQAITGLRQVGASADIEAALKGTVQVPAAFVVPIGETPEKPTTTVMDQRVCLRFGVLLCVVNRADAQGAAALSGLEPVRKRLRDCLLGWTPQPETGEPVSFARGRFFRLDAGRLWWLDEFDFFTYYESK